MFNNFSYIVTAEDEKKDLTVKELLSLRFNISSRMRTKIKKHKAIFLNDTSVPPWINPKAGDIITINLPKEKSYFPPENIPLDIVFEDEHLLIVNKQPGLVTHPTMGHPNGTLANGIAALMKNRQDFFKIRFVNRLDRDTSGLMILAKNSHAQHILSQQMKANKLKKTYIALATGNINPEKGTIALPIKRGEGSDIRRAVKADGAMSVTIYQIIKKFKGYSLLELVLETGRTHQIRVHLSHLGHPLAGDTLYGGSMFLDGKKAEICSETGLPPYIDYIPSPPAGEEDNWLIGRQALHAYSLTFNHPVTGRYLHLEAPLGKDFNEALEKLSPL